MTELTKNVQLHKHIYSREFSRQIKLDSGNKKFSQELSRELFQELFSRNPVSKNKNSQVKKPQWSYLGI